MIEDIPQFGEVEAGADYVLRPGGYLVTRNGRGEIGVAETPRGFFLPGGGQDDGETPEQAAIREAIEECGLYVRIARRLGVADELVWSVSEGTHFRKRCTFFGAEYIRNEGLYESDHELVWLPADKAATTLAHKSQAWAVTLELKYAREF